MSAARPAPTQRSLLKSRPPMSRFYRWWLQFFSLIAVASAQTRSKNWVALTALKTGWP
ncbi:hypothetical protein Poly21_32970 [Allorhodopirellula heiligendammensis]|uniref:Uncharacterized protein n=1 Tax=Allorhodopirellula heiligendammensis TaxID=2714739 RepID=A0A5C6BW22_9BACT|nr:hypothetical protein Poly21_32970 [Allorhodopirellula heiligendammensis]